jgi:hypothetical protein
MGMLSLRSLFGGWLHKAGSRASLRDTQASHIVGKKQGATGITTVAPYIAGQWGRGDNRLPE